MKFKKVKNYIELNESNLNRVLNGHDEDGYIILSACREDLVSVNEENMKTDICYSIVNDKYIVSKDSLSDNTYYDDINNQQKISANDLRTRELKEKIRINNYSFIPVFGGYKEEGSATESFEKSFIVFPFDISTKQKQEFDKFVNDMFSLGNYFSQETILIKYKDDYPAWYECKTKSIVGDKFKSKSVNDTVKMYFTALKKWGTGFEGSSQRFSLEEMYMNDYPAQISSMYLRSKSGELTKYK